MRFLKSLVYIVFIAAVIQGTGCSSGGDGDSAPAIQPLTYVGNTNPASITLDNAPTLIANVLYGGESVTSIPTGVSVSEITSYSEDTLLNHELASLLRYSFTSFVGDIVSGYNIPSGFAVDETIQCETGYYSLTGTLDDTYGTGILAVEYVDCVLEGSTYNGSGTMDIYNIDIYTGSFGATLDFVLLTISGPDLSGAMSGSINLDEYIYGNQATSSIVLNAVTRDDLLNKMFKYDNYVMNMSIADIYNPSSNVTMWISGTIYDSTHGGISAQTLMPLEFDTLMDTEPESGGPVLMTGSDSRMQLTVESIKHTLLELDLDNNGSFEILRYLLWQELENSSSIDLADTDSDGMHDSWESLYSLDPTTDDSGEDADFDTYTNLVEYQAGSNPQNTSSIPGSP
jgi:hypothetical protein